MRSRPALALLAVALPTAACNTDAPNPFAPRERSAPIPADARLIFTSDAWSARSGAPREVFAARADGGGVTRITSCNSDEMACDTLEADASPDRERLVMRRVTSDTNGDGRLSEADDAALVAVDLRRGLEATIVQSTAKVTGVDWSAIDDLVLYSGVGGNGALEDIWGIQANGRDNGTIVASPTTVERRPRLNATSSAALYERVGPEDGKAVIWIVTAGTSPATLGGDPGARLAGTPYIVGADADAAFAPDSRSFVFRRLTSTDLAPLGTWDLLAAAFDGMTPRVVAGGGRVYRGPPDWGPEGIVFPEFDGTQWRLVLVAPDGTTRRVLVTLPAGQRLTSVRWLP
jgi:hypothetical protein